jgi:hypothetical protein
MRASWLARDSWFGLDKLDHFVYAVAYWLGIAALTSSPWTRLGLFAAGAIGIELVELVRFRIWVRKGRPQPWPPLCDAFSYRDLVWDAGGALAAIWALGRIAARVALLLALLVGLPAAAAAQKAPKQLFNPFHMGSATLDSTAYGQELQLYLPPFHGFVIVAPAGDTIVILNGVRFDSLPAPVTGPLCTARAGAPVVPAVAVSRLVVGRPDSIWWTQDFPERGQGRLYAHWAELLRSGDTLRLSEVWRRRSECSTHDGTLVVLFALRRGGRGR